MPKGKVKWFNNAKGYGFILPKDGGGSGEDLFAHYSSVNMEGYKTLKAGQLVSYNILQGPKGLHAVDIKLLSEEGGETVIAEEKLSETTIEEQGVPAGQVGEQNLSPT